MWKMRVSRGEGKQLMTTWNWKFWKHKLIQMNDFLKWRRYLFKAVT